MGNNGFDGDFRAATESNGRGTGAGLATRCQSCHRVPVLPKKGIPLTPWHPGSDPARRGIGSRLDGAFGDWATLFTPLEKLVAFSPIYAMPHLTSSGLS